MMSLTARLAALALLLSLTALRAGESGAQPGDDRNPFLDSHLALLSESVPSIGTAAAATPDPSLSAMLDAGLMRLDAAGRVQVYAHPSGSIDRLVKAIESLGGMVDRVHKPSATVQVWMPAEGLTSLAELPFLRYARLPDYGVGDAGSRVTEGDAIQKSNVVRSAFGATGQGVRVGVISDGVGGLPQAQASGDLPAVDTTTCNAVPVSDPQSTGSEGTAMLEIIHDIAPRAQLFFGNYAFGSSLEFMDAVECLSSNVDVVVDDISWFNAGPYDGTSAVALNSSHQLARLDAPVRAAITSVGNSGNRHYRRVYTPCEDTNKHRFAATANTVDADGLGGRCSNPVRVERNVTLLVFLSWDDPYEGSCNDYDLRLKSHDSNDVLASSTNPQVCFQNPTESLAWTNNTGSVATVDIEIENRNGEAQARTLQMFVVGGRPNFFTPGGSVPAQADAGGGVISVGAIGAGNQGHNEVQPYSSRGPTADGRLKPEIVSVDCVQVTGAGGFGSPFCGTSAAAPHVAGLAAQILSCNRGLLDRDPGDDPLADRQALRNILQLNADPRGAPVPNNTFGYGLANALRSAENGCVASTVAAGDANCDRVVDSLDALFVQRFVAGIVPVALCIEQADVDCNGVVDSLDALHIQRYVAGLPALPVPPGCPPIGVLSTFR